MLYQKNAQEELKLSKRTRSSSMKTKIGKEQEMRSAVRSEVDYEETQDFATIF